ncbi:MAG TPA: TA system VapC family ribonuclease toxin [Rudaea sp.]|nr:TA system VapC family ribonuclease toxin [Rudaea sp.]
MVAVDTNILIYAHMRLMPLHDAAVAALTSLAETGADWCVPWSCVHEFCSVVTRQKLFNPPLTQLQALAAIERLRSNANCRFLCEGPGYWAHFEHIVRASGVAGGAIHDARVAAVCLEHEVDELWTHDRDFRKFPGLRVRNPLN